MNPTRRSTTHLPIPLAMLTCGLAAFACATAAAQSSIRITLDTTRRFQTITGWEAHSQSGQDFPAFARYREHLFDRAVNELGITRLRLEVRSGSEHVRDTWQEFRQGAIDYATWRGIRYATINDNADPFSLNPSGFHFAMLDSTVTRVVLPFKAMVEAAGQRFFLNVNYVAFTGQITAGNDYHHDDPEEYAEFVLATCLHLRDVWGLVPDAWEVILEPDNTAYWRGRQIGLSIVAAARRLAGHGIAMRFIAPSTTNMARAPEYFDSLLAVPGAVELLEELSYHRYGGVSDAALAAITARADRHGINTSMLEHIGSGEADLLADLTKGNVSAWQQFTLAFPAAADDGGAYYRIDTNASGAEMVIEGSRTRRLRPYFRAIRPGMTRVDARSAASTVVPVAFVAPDGAPVIVLKSTYDGQRTLSLDSLRPGRWLVESLVTASREVDLGATAELTAPGPDILTLRWIGPAPTSVADDLEGSDPRIGYDLATATLVLSGAHDHGAYVELYTMLGQRVLRTPVAMRIPIEGLPAGMYFARVTGVIASTQRVVVPGLSTK